MVETTRDLERTKRKDVRTTTEASVEVRRQIVVIVEVEGTKYIRIIILIIRIAMLVWLIERVKIGTSAVILAIGTWSDRAQGSQLDSTGQLALAVGPPRTIGIQQANTIITNTLIIIINTTITINNTK